MLPQKRQPTHVRHAKMQGDAYMKVIKIAGLLFLYAFDVLLLGLVEKLVNGLVKKLNACLISTRSAIDRINEKRAALKKQRSENA